MVEGTPNDQEKQTRSNQTIARDQNRVNWLKEHQTTRKEKRRSNQTNMKKLK